MRIKKLVLDILIPRELHIVELSLAIAGVNGVEEVKTTVQEVDERTSTLKVEVSGNGINYEEIYNTISHHGASLRSVDEVIVVSGKSGFREG